MYAQPLLQLQLWVLERIPKAARHQCHLKLTAILEAVVVGTSVDAWNQLFCFSTSCLRVSARKRGRTSVQLASRVKEEICLEKSPTLRNLKRQTAKHPHRRDDPCKGWLVW